MLRKVLKGLAGIALMSLVLVSCKDKENEIVETLSVSPDAGLTFEAAGNSDVVLMVTTNAESWKATGNDWIVLTQNENKLTVNVKENTSSEKQFGRIRITAGLAQPVAINVVQAGKASEEIPDGKKVATKLTNLSEASYATKTDAEIVVKVKASLAEASDSPVEVELFVDGDYLPEYNFLNGVDAVVFPVDKVIIPNEGKITFAAGETESAEIEIKLDPSSCALGETYVLPLYLKSVKNASVKQADCRVNVVVNKINPKAVKNVVYFEVNDCNPLNALEYLLEDGTPFIDAVILFAANINYNTADDVVYLHNNANVQALLDETDIYLQPLRKRGIKVYLGLLGNHDAAGLCQLSDWGAAEWAKEVAEACKTYKLDGVNLDDEYSSTPISGNRWFTTKSAAAGARLCYELKKALAEACSWPTEVSYFAWGSLYTVGNVTDQVTGVEHTPKEFIDFYVANYGSATSPYGDLEMSNCSGASIQLNYGNTITTSKAQSIKEAGYGWCMWFAFDPSGTGSVSNNRTHSLYQFQNAAQGFYGQTVVAPTGVYNKLGEGKYDPERHAI